MILGVQVFWNSLDSFDKLSKDQILIEVFFCFFFVFFFFFYL